MESKGGIGGMESKLSTGMAEESKLGSVGGTESKLSSGGMSDGDAVAGTTGNDSSLEEVFKVEPELEPLDFDLVDDPFL